MKEIGRDKMEHYLRRAEQFLRAVELLKEDRQHYGNAAALLTVHSAISFADALLIAFAGRRSDGEDHAEALEDLRRACGRAGIDTGGLGHFSELVSMKTRIAYGDETLHPQRVIEFAILKAERFAAWVFKSLKQAGLKGPDHAPDS